MRRVALLLGLLLLPDLAAAQAPEVHEPHARPVVVTGHIDSLWSSTLKERRQLLIYTPPGYDSSRYLPRRYPVLYLLDGDAHFQSVTGLVQILSSGINASFVIPPMIVVAIANTDRTRDLTPTHSQWGPDGKYIEPSFKNSGGGPTFLRFVRTELIPYVDSAYRTTDYRVFVGHSFGGLTVIDALYTMPATFNAYVAIDPSLWWDHEVLLKKARDYFGTPGLGGRTLFLAQANTISATDTAVNLHYNAILHFNAILSSENRSGIRYAYHYFPDDDHGSVPFIAEYDALRYIFAGYHVDMLRALADPTYLTHHFADVSAHLHASILPPEQLVDQLATFEMGRDTTKALELYAMNAALYPSSPHALDQLADAWLARGDREKALTYYGKALAQNPDDRHAAERANRLTAQVAGGRRP